MDRTIHRGSRDPAILLIRDNKTVHAHGGDPTLIHSCVKNGSLRVVDPSEACKGNETALDRNIEGSPGPAGPPGISGLEIVRNNSEIDTAGQKAIFVECPEPKRALGGGFELLGDITTVQILASRSSNLSLMNGWLAEATKSGANPWGVHVQAICANVSP